MRNPKRIKPFCDKLAKYWKQEIPDWRFGQFMSNFFGWCLHVSGKDIFYIEEDEMSELLDKFFAENP